MNYWEEKPQFWKNKITDNEIYALKNQEIAKDLEKLEKEIGGIKTLLDVGGYTGELEKYLPSSIKYQYIDIKNGFDITKNWFDQGIYKKYDVVLTSLVLITIPPEHIKKLMNRIIKRSNKAIYIYEEDPKLRKHGEVINENYGGKWTITLPGLLKGQPGFKKIKAYRSQINPAWVKYTIIK